MRVKERPALYDWYTREDSVGDYIDLIDAGSRMFFIRERSLTPRLEIGAKVITPGYLSLNGLLHLDSGHVFPDDHERFPECGTQAALGWSTEWPTWGPTRSGSTATTTLCTLV